MEFLLVAHKEDTAVNKVSKRMREKETVYAHIMKNKSTSQVLDHASEKIRMALQNEDYHGILDALLDMAALSTKIYSDMTCKQK